MLRVFAMASASAQWLEQLRLDLPAQRANQRSPWLRKTLTALPVEGRDRASLLGLCGELQISGCRKRVRLSKEELVEKVLNEVLEQLPAASSSAASMISTYLRTVRAELRQQHPEGREAWLKAEIDSMRLKQGIHDKPSLVDFCKYLNLTVGNAAGPLGKPELLTKAVEKLMSEARHVVGSAASSSSSGVDAAVVKRFVQVLRVALTQQNPEERRSNLERDLGALSHRTSKDGKPSLVDIGRFLALQVGSASGGWLRKEDIISNIVDKLIEQLPGTSAASSTPAMGFMVAFMFFSLELFQCGLVWNDIYV